VGCLWGGRWLGLNHLLVKCALAHLAVLCVALITRDGLVKTKCGLDPPGEIGLKLPCFSSHQLAFGLLKHEGSEMAKLPAPGLCQRVLHQLHNFTHRKKLVCLKDHRSAPVELIQRGLCVNCWSWSGTSRESRNSLCQPKIVPLRGRLSLIKVPIISSGDGTSTQTYHRWQEVLSILHLNGQVERALWCRQRQGRSVPHLELTCPEPIKNF
jgi:hypothetical protein